MNSTPGSDEPDPAGIKTLPERSARDQPGDSSDVGECILVCLFTCFLLVVGLLLNGAVGATVNYVGRLLGQ